MILEPIPLDPPLYPFLTLNPIPKNAKREAIKFIQRQRGASVGPGRPCSISDSWGRPSGLAPCCGELERSPVSAGALEADFCSRLVGWGDKTELTDTTPAEYC
ncbi:unnamed protein product [Rangifer tarandus platyrhynchus]|uniref:Uncharacterized protein n=2 Tax=Rangifer tarandus platyrhynchus TaxID=3082113 RepID=A0ABN8YWK5_RANTA|nr:unnamed protein product [Rangifer tarandus platyrhynchus]CAI9702383.1 unnamed protein product [Rangifer tarandus platyrhynchus]